MDALQSIKKDLPNPITDILTDSVAAVSVGLLNDEVLLDLEYVEDRDADVDMNLEMTGSGKFIEVQGTGEESTFTRDQRDALLRAGEKGIQQITKAQKESLGKAWPK